MDDECDTIKQLVLTDLKPSVITLGDELNLSVLLKDEHTDDEAESVLLKDEHTNEESVLLKNEHIDEEIDEIADEDPSPACRVEHIDEEVGEVADKDPLPACRVEKDETTKTNELACSVCGKQFSCKKFLNRHFDRHTNRFQCNSCGKVLSRKNALLSHIPRCKLNQNAAVRPPKIIKVSQKDVNKYSCEICSKSFTRRENYEQHCMTHYGIHVLCSICDKVLRSLKSYRRHMKTHEDEKPSFHCAFCPSEFSLKSNLKRHELRQHFMLMTCEKCNQKVKNENILQKHKDNAISCAICSESFCLKSHLKTHQKLMHNNVWLICKKCSSETPFLTKCEYHLKAHVRKLHDIILESGDCYRDKWFVFIDS